MCLLIQNMYYYIDKSHVCFIFYDTINNCIDRAEYYNLSNYNIVINDDDNNYDKLFNANTTDNIYPFMFYNSENIEFNNYIIYLLEHYYYNYEYITPIIWDAGYDNIRDYYSNSNNDDNFLSSYTEDNLDSEQICNNVINSCIYFPKLKNHCKISRFF